MNELEKLKEAKYFLKYMEYNQNEPEYFKYELSAFLSAGRSVLQYACKETYGTRNQKWYDKRIHKTQIFEYFRDIRNENVHAEPLNLPKNINVVVNESINVKDSVKVEVIRGGKVVDEPDLNQKAVIAEPPIKKVDKTKHSTTSTIDYEYFFEDRRDKNVLTLCREYLKDLELFIGEGVKKGKIAG